MNDSKEYTSKAYKASGIAFAAECFAKVISPIINMVLARVLCPEAFGIVVTINMVISFAEMLSSSGFQKYLVQAEFKNEGQFSNAADVAFWTNLFISLVGVLIITVFNDPIARIVGSPGYGISIVVASFALPITSLSSIFEAFYQRKLEYKVLFWVRIVSCFVPLVVTLPLALMGFEHWALIWGTLGGHIIRNILFLIFNKNWRPHLFYSVSVFKDMLSFGIWTLFESFVNWLVTWIDVFIVSNSLSLYYTGLYKTAQTTVTSILSIFTAATQPVLFSLLSKLKNDKTAFKKNFLSYIQNMSVFLLPAGVGLLLYSRTITQILLGAQWEEASSFVGMWGFATALVCLYGHYNREAYRAIGKPKVAFYVQVLHLIFIFPVCLFAAQKGFSTLIVVRSISYLQVLLIHMHYSKKYLNVSAKEMVLSTKKPILATLIMSVLAIIMKMILPNTFVISLAGMVICCVFYLFITCCFKEYREMLIGFVKKILCRFHIFG